MQNESMKNVAVAAAVGALLILVGGGVLQAQAPPSQQSEATERVRRPEKSKSSGGWIVEKVVKTDEEWKAELTPEQYRVLRQKGTERAFSADSKSKGEGIYKCAGCGTELFESDTKFDSGCGWPSFFKPIAGNVEEESDVSHGMRRTEVLCAACGGHLGHVFEDGPKPTGQRYCINDASLQFEKKDGA